MINWQPGTRMEDVEKQVILKALKVFNGSRVEVAKSLGLSRKTIDNKLEKYDAEEKAFFENQERVYEKDLEFMYKTRGQLEEYKNLKERQKLNANQAY